MNPSRDRGNERFALRLLRVAAAVIVCLGLLTIGLFGLAYYLLQGKVGESSSIITRVERSLEVLVGEDFDVRLGETDLDFSNFGRVTLKSENISIVRRSDKGILAEVGKIEVSTELWDVLSGNENFDFARIDEALIDAGLLGSGQAVFLPAHLNKPLDVTGKTLARLNESFTADGFESFEIYNSTIIGPVFGRKQTDPITIDRLNIFPKTDESFEVSGVLRTELSEIEYQSVYSTGQSGKPAQYEFEATGLNMREWLDDPGSDQGLFASDSVVSVLGTLPFDSKNDALDPGLHLRFSKSMLRIGLLSSTDIKAATLNFRLLLDKNQIEMDPSEVEIGRLKASVFGGIKPFDEVAGYFGPLRYDIIMRRGSFEPTIQGEKSETAAFKLAGIYHRTEKRLDIRRVVLTTKNGSITGSGALGFDGETPSIKARATTEGISVAALKQFWPFFVAQGARKWIHDHIIDGWVSSGSVVVDVPPGIVFKLRQGAKLKPEHFKTVLNLEKLKFRPFGELPPISEAEGLVTLEGMKISADMTRGEVTNAVAEPVTIQSGSFELEDFAAKERWAEVNMEIDGGVRDIAVISDKKPLRAMERLKVKPAELQGKGHANIAARFPVGRKAKYEEVEWNVLVDLVNGSSSKKLSGRKIADANVLIDANPFGAKVTGSMKIDGVASRINFVEPIGKSGKVKKRREIRTTLNEKDRLALGIDLKPVIEGPVKIKVVESERFEKYELNFKDAIVSLPWVGWSKGADIPATGEFVLKRLKKGVRLEDFSIVGPGFNSSGKLQIDKRGLVSANLDSLTLNDRDSLQLKLERTDTAYNINASGLSYDARGIINSLIHQGGFKKAQGERSVNLVANFDEVTGFGSQSLRNVILLYESKSGRLNRLDLQAKGVGGQFFNVQAQLNGDQTLFNASSSDAGAALAFTNLYSRMQGGRLDARLVQTDSGPYLGPVRITDFSVVNEPRLKSIASSVRSQIPRDRGERVQIFQDDQDRKVKFLLADAQIERGKDYFRVTDAIVRSATIGMTMNGTVYDPKDRMDIKGTFMPANGLNLAVSTIPLLGQLFSNGRDNGLIGVTYQLKGVRTNPELVVNPLSIVAPGIFNKVFEFQ